ncbi:cytochrome P450 [Russula vinacea]|nr:cytochrome P450 [Russula vinacea]
MSSLSASLLGLPEVLKSLSLRLWLTVQAHGTLSIGIVLGLIVLYAARYLANPYRKLPPGPRGHPIIGNLLEMKGGQWLKFAEWHKKYGDLIYLNAAGQPVVVINSQKVAVELLDRRAAIYSDRPQRLFKAAVMGVYLVHFFPWLRHLPSSLAKWKRDAESWYKQDTALFESLLRMVEVNVAKGDDYQSVTATLIREVEKNKLSQIERAWIGGTMYVGGADTTSAMMGWWMLAMLAYPETQARAHAELDAIVGRARLPTFADYPHLPYIRAMVKEALRWRPVAPLGVPHQSTEDDWYEGMFIPKGTFCLTNVWHMNRDPEIFGKNTEHFDPARYLDASGDLASGVSDIKEQGHFSYGFGRRNCVGRHMADDSLFINIAVMLWATKIERKKDGSGRFLPLDLDGWVDVGVVVRPVPFEFEITPRFSEATAMLSQERELRGL